MKIGSLVRWRGQTPDNRPLNADYGCFGVVIEYREKRLVIAWIDGTVGIFKNKSEFLEVVNV